MENIGGVINRTGRSYVTSATNNMTMRSLAYRWVSVKGDKIEKKERNGGIDTDSVVIYNRTREH